MKVYTLNAYIPGENIGGTVRIYSTVERAEKEKAIYEKINHLNKIIYTVEEWNVL